jgi:hypothetical protein
MKIDFKGILEGAWNSVFVKESIEKIANERDAICRGCSENSDHAKKYKGYKTFRPDFHCTVCLCDLHMKTRALSQACPKGKWLAQTDEESAYEIQQKLEKDGESSN